MGLEAHVIALTAAVVVASVLSACQQLSGPPASPSPVVTPTLSAPPLVVSYESPAFGYRIQLPAGFRRSDCLSAWFSQGATFGSEAFTLLSPEQERAQNWGHIAAGGPVAMWTLWVNVLNADGRSTLEWAREHGSHGGVERHEPVVISGYEATRTVVDGEARLYVVRAGERMYLISLHFDSYIAGPRPDVLPQGVLDSVALTFRAGPARGPILTPSPQPAVPPSGARQAAARLAASLEAGDADRVAAVITPRCWLHIVIPQAGPTGRAVDPYVAELRTRFQGGGLRVRVDPTVQVAQEAGPLGLRLFVRSDWTESGRTTGIDLFLREIDGQWHWAGAQFR